jgi:hypothetical protein
MFFGLFLNNVVPFSINLVLRAALFSINLAGDVFGPGDLCSRAATPACQAHFANDSIFDSTKAPSFLYSSIPVLSAIVRTHKLQISVFRVQQLHLQSRLTADFANHAGC